MDAELLSSPSSLLVVWIAALSFAIVTAAIAGLFPERLEKIRTSAFAIFAFPGMLFALVYAARGFGVLERPIVHWVFDKGAQDALHLGLVFDPVSFVAVFFAGAAAVAIAIRNRPTIRTSSALVLSWVGLGLAATAQTIWMAILGIGIQILSRTFPLTESAERTAGVDARWIASAKRAWIGLASLLCGGAGLASQGIHLDFLASTPWSSLEATPSAIVAGALLVFGLLVIATPALSSSALHESNDRTVEENLFVSETSLGWIAVLIFYRAFGNLHEEVWLLSVGVGAAVSTAFSIAALTFQSSRTSAIHLWLATAPVATLVLLPFLPAREANLLLLGALVATNGLWVAIDHPRTKADVATAAAFYLGATGFVGWATSAGYANFFSRLESDPALRIPIFLLLLLYQAFGWRLVVRGGDRKENPAPAAKWAALGIFFVLGFGPLMSGRFGGGALPGEPDWIEGAKAWPWIKAATEGSETDWAGFGLSQGLVLVAALFGIFAWRSSELFPFSKKYPGGERAAKGLFGLGWIQEGFSGAFRRMGAYWTESVSATFWERGIPAVGLATLGALRKIARFVEAAVDPLTSEGYGRIFTPAAKLVQWLHGGNVRLYAWFALIWILIFSIYLTR
ncbi:MAG: hypothetical protein JST04_14095 [Bdellovibrionales bacterium]|nr:hypothetical protein [Bdellovibrionales bacterium]